MSQVRIIPPVESTCCSDPLAKFAVDSVSDISVGVYGFYHNEFDAHRVAKFLKQNGHTHVSVYPYDPTAPETGGIHPLIEMHMKGYV